MAGFGRGREPGQHVLGQLRPFFGMAAPQALAHIVEQQPFQAVPAHGMDVVDVVGHQILDPGEFRQHRPQDAGGHDRVHGHAGNVGGHDLAQAVIDQATGSRRHPGQPA